MKKISVLCLVLAASLHSFAAQSRVCFLLDLECQEGGQTKYLSETDQDCRKLAKELNRRWVFKEEERCQCARYKEVCNDHTGTYYEADGCADHCTDMTDEQNSEIYECSVETECGGCCPNDKVKCKETEYKLCEPPTEPEVPADKKTCLEPGAHESETKYPSCVCNTNVYKYNETNCGGAALKLTGDSCTGDNGTWYEECTCAPGYTPTYSFNIECDEDDCKYGCDMGNDHDDPLPGDPQLYCWSGASCINPPTINDKCSAEGKADFDYYWTGYTVKSEDTETPPTTYCDNLEVDCDKLGYDTGIAETGVTCKDKTEPYRCMFNHEKVFCATGICYYTAEKACEDENFNSACDTPYEGCYEPTRCKEMKAEEKVYGDDGYQKEPCYSEEHPFIGYVRSYDNDDKGPGPDKYGCYKCVSLKCPVNKEEGIFRLPADDSKDKEVLSDEERCAGFVLDNMFHSGKEYMCKRKGCGLDEDFWDHPNGSQWVEDLRQDLYGENGICAKDDSYIWDKSNAGDEGQYELTNPNCDERRYKTCTSLCKEVPFPGTGSATVTETCTACGNTVNTAWECNANYCKSGSECKTVCSNTYTYTENNIPENSYLSGAFCDGYAGTSQGDCTGTFERRYSSFTCDQGYCKDTDSTGKQEFTTCKKLCDASVYTYTEEVANATMTGECTGYYDTSGGKCGTRTTKYSGFTCHTNYCKSGSECKKVCPAAYKFNADNLPAYATGVTGSPCSGLKYQSGTNCTDTSTNMWYNELNCEGGYEFDKAKGECVEKNTGGGNASRTDCSPCLPPLRNGYVCPAGLEDGSVEDDDWKCDVGKCWRLGSNDCTDTCLCTTSDIANGL